MVEQCKFDGRMIWLSTVNVAQLQVAAWLMMSLLLNSTHSNRHKIDHP